MAKYTKYTGYSRHPNNAARVTCARSRQQFSRYDTSEIRPKKNKKSCIIAIGLALVLIVAIGFGIASCSHSCGRMNLADGQEVKITISDNTRSSGVANQLYKAGLIDNESEFLEIVKANNISLKAGDYLFTKGETPTKIAEQIGKGSNYSAGIVVAKGDKISTVATKVEKYSNGKISADEFAKACSDASKYVDEFSFLKEVGNNSVEGFLYPRTYKATEGYTAESLVRAILSNFKTQVEEPIIDKANVQGLSKYGIVILASIVEKESDDNTRAKVASVFLNRLEINMPLQSDATTAYEVGHDPSSDEVHADTPYSTYVHYGLPPTPICSSSIESINAVCNPEDTVYLYFYFKKLNGQMKYYFSTTNEEHNAAINGQRD
ncbi:MAG: endolytic transglycosylase MltG [Eggerthellaceae bacterium]|nr:endolytic transglycosylase MltG [Eggerthellaceae bacterium]